MIVFDGVSKRFDDLVVLRGLDLHIREGEIVARAFRQLEPDERLVLSVYCEEYPKVRGPIRLLKVLLQRDPTLAKKNWTPAIVRRLLNQARMSVKKELLGKGY